MDLKEGLRKMKVCVVVRHKNLCKRPMHNEEHRSSCPIKRKRGQLLKVPCPSCCHCIGKHGHPFSHKGTGFDLQIYFSPAIIQKKVKAASTYRCLSLDNTRPPKGWD